MSLPKPWDPHVWPSLYTQVYALPVALLAQQVVGLRWSVALFAFILVTIAIKIKTIINDRQELFKIFDKGNVPSVEHKNLLSGNLFEVLAPRDNLHTIDRLHKRLGKTFGFFYAFEPYIFTIDLDLCQKFFLTEGHKHIDRNQWRLPFIEEVNLSLVGQIGDEWRHTRRLLEPSFTRKQMHSDNVFRDIELAVEAIINCISGHPLVECEDGTNCRLVDVNYNFKKYTGDVIFRVAYGCDNVINMEPQGRDKLIDTLEEAAKDFRGPVVWTSIIFEGADLALGHLIKFTPMGAYLEYIHGVLDTSLRNRRLLAIAKSNLGLNRRMIDTIIESSTKGHMSDVRIKANLFFIFVAGFETSANTLAIMFWLLAFHQQIQDKLRKALAVDGYQSEYLDWCIRETLRLYPAVPAGVGRILPEDIHWKGQTYYKGTTLNVSIYSIHHSAEYWGPDVEEFKPERFAKAKDFHPMQEFSFGHGPRYCLGKKLAESEMKTLVSRLLLRYRVEPGPNTPKVLHVTSPNIIHMIIHGQVELKFIELSSL